jgi:hypothetical protein
VADIIGKTDVYYDWLRSGGAHSTFVELNRDSLLKITKRLQGNESALKHLNIINDAQQISQVIEIATRLGMYKAALRAGKSDIKAGFLSREGTVDFGVHGSSKPLQQFSSMTAFFNPALQGTDRFIRAHKDNPKNVVLKATTAITIPTVLLWMLNKDDDGYKELPQYQKDLFWMIRVGKDGDPVEFARIPKPFLYGQVYGSSVERFLDYIYSRDVNAFDGFLEALLASSTPIQGDAAGSILPTAIKPLVENATNWSFFKEAPIVSESKEDLMPYLQHGKYTSETAKILGKKFGWSPAKIENFVKGYTGTSGQYALDGMDMALSALDVTSNEKRPRELADVPLLKGFVTRPVVSNPESLSEFYKKADEISAEYKSYQQEIKDMDISDQKELLKQYPELVLYPSIESTRSVISDINRQIEEIISSKKLSDDSKRKTIHRLETIRMKMAKMELKYLSKGE